MNVLDDVTIRPFDESPMHRAILPYNPIYGEVFGRVQLYVQARIATVELFHIGSTAIPDLRGKPMLDIAAVTVSTDLRAEQAEFERIGFHRRNVWVDRDDKPYVAGSVEVNGAQYNVNIHICHRNDPVHKDSLAFLELLRKRPDLRRRYERAKDQAHVVDPINPEIYNRAKEAAIREIQSDISYGLVLSDSAAHNIPLQPTGLSVKDSATEKSGTLECSPLRLSAERGVRREYDES